MTHFSRFCTPGTMSAKLLEAAITHAKKYGTLAWIQMMQEDNYTTPSWVGTAETAEEAVTAAETASPDNVTLTQLYRWCATNLYWEEWYGP